VYVDAVVDWETSKHGLLSKTASVRQFDKDFVRVFVFDSAFARDDEVELGAHVTFSYYGCMMVSFIIFNRVREFLQLRPRKLLSQWNVFLNKLDFCFENHLHLYPHDHSKVLSINRNEPNRRFRVGRE
jgi:hypothetical protein